MAYEVGGRADKYGNRFELNWTIKKLIDVIEEKLESVLIEAVGDEERGVDLWIKEKNGEREAQQCKARNGSQEFWDFSSVNQKGIWENWKLQLEKSKGIRVALVSPLSFSLFHDIGERARNNNSDAGIFYEYQIKRSGKKTIDLFDEICRVMGIDLSSDEGEKRALNYFSRMYYRQESDGELRERNLERIKFLFIGKEEKIHGLFLDYIYNKNIWGKEIDFPLLEKFLKENSIEFRNLARDERIWPTIRRLNEEYSQIFTPFSKGLLYRKETEHCLEHLLGDRSVILHGNAGVGKSGCVENLINRLNDKEIEYLAIKLDRNIPLRNSEIWAKNMGLPVSISHCINAITKKKAVIILDQLDALRWTQEHSGTSLTICMQIIKEVKQINKERQNPINFVFVCRTYDLENDHNISSLFREDEKSKWEKVRVGNLSDEELQSLIGEKINTLSPSLRKLITIPSNLFLWEKLDKGRTYNNIKSTYQLVQEWWEQVELSCHQKKLDTNRLLDIKDRIINFCYEYSRMNVPKIKIKITADYEDFLISFGVIIVEKQSVSFTHQSILDCFFAEEMINSYYSSHDILKVIGPKEKQIPVRRYQTQIFLQQLSEYSIEDALDVGRKMLDEGEIRYCFKYIFIELLSSFDPLDKVVSECVLELMNNKKWEDSIRYSVIIGSSNYVHWLRDDGALEAWINIERTRDFVIELMLSIKDDLDEGDISLLKKILNKGIDNNKWMPFFMEDISKDTDAFFEFRLEMYERFPNLMLQYLEIDRMMRRCERRTIRVLALMLNERKKRNQEVSNKYEDEISSHSLDFLISDYEFALKTLLPYFPDIKEDIRHSSWDARYAFSISLERLCVIIVKSANKSFAEKEPGVFLEFYQPAFGQGSSLYNEIILDGMQSLDISYSDYVLNYLCENSFINAMEDSSGNGNSLLLAKKLISNFSITCSDEVLRNLEMKIMKFVDPDAKESLKFRMSDNRYQKEIKENHFYWSFWGNFQQELLSAISEHRRSAPTNALLMVLSRRYDNFSSKYCYESGGGCYSIVSSISEKTLTLKNWIQIIKSKNVKERGKIRWKLVNGQYIENSIETFASSFREFVRHYPIEITEYMSKDCSELIDERFIDAFLGGLSESDEIAFLDEITLKKLIEKYGYHYDSYRALDIVKLIQRVELKKERDYFLEIIWDIIVKYESPKDKEKNNIFSYRENIQKFSDIEIISLNSAKGAAIGAFSNLLRKDEEMYHVYKDKLEILFIEKNPAIRLASLFILLQIYQYDKDWTANKMMKIMEHDFRLVGFRYSGAFFVECFEQFSDNIIKILDKAVNSKDDRLEQVASYIIVDLYMEKGIFKDISLLYEKANNNVKTRMLERIINYLKESSYREKSRALLKEIVFITEETNNGFLWGRLFGDKLVDLEKDRGFICSILKSKIQRNVLVQFSEFIREERKIKDYSDIILDLSIYTLDHLEEIRAYWGLDTELSKLIISLYDETANSKRKEDLKIAKECLDVWDKMYKKNVGMARRLTEQMLEI